MPIQLPKIPCKICKMLFEPTNSGHKMYCGDKCTNTAGNSKKRMRREGLRKNIEILNSLNIPLNSSISSSNDELQSKGFKGEFNSKYLEIWSEQDGANAYRVYYGSYVVVNQRGKLTIYSF
jgi:hypothetical protein